VNNVLEIWMRLLTELVIELD